MRVEFNVDAIAGEIDKLMLARMEKAMRRARAIVLETLSGSRSGKRYKVPGTKGAFYTASAPGEPPAVATARLRQSIQTEVVTEGDQIIGVVGTDLEYGRHLEYGTRNMEPRPWIKPSIEKVLPELNDLFRSD